MSAAYGLCPKCLEIKDLTRHHIFPKRFFKGCNNAILYICRECHDELEMFIPQRRKLSREKYLDIARDFIYVNA